MSQSFLKNLYKSIVDVKLYKINEKKRLFYIYISIIIFFQLIQMTKSKSLSTLFILIIIIFIARVTFNNIDVITTGKSYLRKNIFLNSNIIITSLKSNIFNKNRKLQIERSPKFKFQENIDISNKFKSPFNGTDIISHPIALIKCLNQTKCIQPNLQLTKKFKVYYCKHVSHGVRFYFLIREGLLLHPNIILVSNPDDADIIVYLPESANWRKVNKINNFNYLFMIIYFANILFFIFFRPSVLIQNTEKKQLY
jgi:hypothetical protein